MKLCDLKPKNSKRQHVSALEDCSFAFRGGKEDRYLLVCAILWHQKHTGCKEKVTAAALLWSCFGVTACYKKMKKNVLSDLWEKVICIWAKIWTVVDRLLQWPQQSLDMMCMSLIWRKTISFFFLVKCHARAWSSWTHIIISSQLLSDSKDIHLVTPNSLACSHEGVQLMFS